MRYYDITLYKDGSPPTAVKTWSAKTASGQPNPSALQVEFDVNVLPFGVPTSACYVTIHGVSFDDLKGSQNFVGMTLIMKGGMQAGLPLANPLQASTILNGLVYESVGNWQGTELSITLVVVPGKYTMDSPGNLVLNWKAGTLLTAALSTMFSTAYPGFPVTMNVTSGLSLAHDEQHFSSTLDGIATAVRDMTAGQFVGSSYPGVSIALQAGTIIVHDGTSPPSTTQLQFTDFIGQPTWVGTVSMMVPLVMRGDIRIGTKVRMPQGASSVAGQVGVTADAANNSGVAQAKYSTLFSGDFLVLGMRHIGNFRSSDGSSWMTLLSCTAIPNG